MKIHITSLRLKFSYLVLIISYSTFGQKSVIALEGSIDMSYVIYKNKEAIIRFSYLDVINEMDRVMRSSWYQSIDSAKQKEIVEIYSDLRNHSVNDAAHFNPLSDKAKGTAKLWNVEKTKYFNNDSTMITLIKRSVGASLLLSGKVSVWKRNGLEKMDIIVLKSNSRKHQSDSSSFYFPKERTPFFTGLMLKDTELVLDTIYNSPPSNKIVDIKIPVEEQSEDFVYLMVERMPYYPGGVEELQNVVNRNLINRKLKIKGIFYLELVVNGDGTISDVWVIEGSDENTNSEIAHEIGSCDGWVPGKQKDQNVRVRIKLKIRISPDLVDEDH